MKKTIFIALLAFFSSTTALFADPWDCMSKEQAEELMAHLQKNPFVFDYCDCCDEVSREYDNKKLMGHLVKIEKMEIKACSWDETQFSVYVVSTTMIASGYVEGGNFKIEQTKNEVAAGYYAEDWSVAINYCFALDKGKPTRLYKMIKYEGDDVNCGGLKNFPDPNKIPKSKIQKAYAKYYSKKK